MSFQPSAVFTPSSLQYSNASILYLYLYLNLKLKLKLTIFNPQPFYSYPLISAV